MTKTETVGQRIRFIGPVPPPMSGQSVYNEALLGQLRAKANVVVWPTGSDAKSKILAAVVNSLRVFIRVSRDDVVYCSAPGQRGLWLVLLTILSLRIRRVEHYVHHHSFRPINLAPVLAHRVLAKIGGNLQRHIFLSEEMRDTYAASYLTASQRAQALVVPNAFLFADDTLEFPRRQGPIVVGHMSVITVEKGVDHILEVAQRLDEHGLTFLLAGPIPDPRLRRRVETAVSVTGNLEWLGPVSGKAKANFYQRSDLFLLPTRLVDEADPLVLLEAFSAGSVVLASKTGCIPERILDQNHLLSLDPASDANQLLVLAADVEADRDLWAKRAQQHASSLRQRAQAQGQLFLEALTGDQQPRSGPTADLV